MPCRLHPAAHCLLDWSQSRVVNRRRKRRLFAVPSCCLFYVASRGAGARAPGQASFYVRRLPACSRFLLPRFDGAAHASAVHLPPFHAAAAREKPLITDHANEPTYVYVHPATRIGIVRQALEREFMLNKDVSTFLVHSNLVSRRFQLFHDKDGLFTCALQNWKDSFGNVMYRPFVKEKSERRGCA